jgi:hypothetical protein
MSVFDVLHKEGFERTHETRISSRNGESFEETKFRIKIDGGKTLQTTSESRRV